jgi:hypothetical protein
MPVVVELFSSEGCSSCPPADALLAALSDQASVGGADVIALEWHVDYWNGLGWADPFSSETATERQRDYARRLHAGVYTPQMVVDGAAQFVGSDRDSARREIAAAAQQRHRSLTMSPVAGDEVRIRAEGAPAGASLLLVVTESHLSTAVPHGENAGRTLAHGPVVRWSVSESVGAGGSVDVVRRMPHRPEWRRENVSLAAFIQAGDGRILGAARLAAR